MMNQYLKELEQDPFDPDEFVERMVRRSMQESRLKDDQFDPEMIHDIFTQAIQDLKVLQERQERKCARLEQSVQEEEKLYGAKLAEIMDQHTHCVNVFSSLDERMSRCGGRALDVGEKLGAARAPRARAAAARDLLSHLAHFLSPGPVLTDLFNDSNKLNEAADVIQKLHTIAQELPPDKFEVAKKKIEAKYDEIERNLIEEFVKAQNQGNMAKMKDIANIMTNFKGYSQCVDAFIETCQMNTLLGKDIFAAVVPVCKKNYTIISNVFPNPDQVMSKFVLNIFHLKLQKYIQTKLADKNDVEKYLRNLYEMYTSTQRVSDELVSAGLVSADGNTSSGDLRREALVSGAMAGAAEGYAALETRRLKAVLANALNGYYSEKQHVKKQIQGGGFQELRRDLQAVIGTRANINIAQIENYGGETFLSETLVQKILTDAKTSFLRCKTLCTPNELPGTTITLLDVLIQHLLIEHVDYALDLGLQSIPIAESKSPPQIHFFDIVKQANKMVRMFEEHFQESVLPCISSTSKQTECVQKKTTIMEQLENKLEAGLERAISAIVGWVKLHLQTEQKKTDFKPEGDIDTLASPACAAVVSYLNSVMDKIHGGLEGDNLHAVTLELAVRLHRVIYEHLQNFQFNSAGAMIAICDVKEYRSAACGRGARAAPAPAHALFDALHALCNLLLVKPENLHQVCEGETLAELDHSILLNFIQLRSDYKSHKLSSFLKGFQELRRDLQAVIGTRANINIAQIENYGGETFLSETLVQKILTDAKTSFLRCKTLCTPNELPGTTITLLDVLIQHLLIEHVDYALDLGLQSIPIAESKSPPQIHFFDIVKQANKMVRMFEEHFQESVLPCISSTSKQTECVQKKTTIMEQLENKLEAGLERAISAIVGWVKLHLQTEQKKTDFKPEGDIDTLASPACAAVVSYLNSVMDKIHGGLEGDNLHAVTLELAVRLHRVIYEHLQNFQFNSAGAMIAICDVKEYRSAACGRGARAAPAPAHALFDALHALCNLLLVKPENLHQVCEGETLAELDHSILLNFIQLRSDYKSHKLSSFLKGLS